jgi:hypothetical protein
MSNNSHNFAKILGIMRTNIIQNRVNKAIDEAANKSLFTTADFPQYDSTYVSKILSAANANGKLVRLANGIYAKPAHTQYGTALPSMLQVAEAIARRDHVKILPIGETAENLFGLSEQVPTKAVFLTSGSGRTIIIGTRELEFKRGVPRNFIYKDKILAAFCKALQSIGVKNLTNEQMQIVYNVMRHYKGNAESKKDIMLMPNEIKKLLLKVSKTLEYEVV